MAGPHGTDSASAHDAFVSDVEYECAMLWGETKRKVKEEEETLENLLEVTYGGASIYWLFNSETVANLENTKSLYEYIRDNQIFKFAEENCFDIESISDAKASLDYAKSKFQIGTPLAEVTGSLEASWPADANDTALLFRENYIDPIADIFADQTAALTLAYEDIDAVTAMVNMSRESLLEAIRDTRSTMESYDPKTNMTLASVHVTLFAWGLAAPDPVSGVAATITDTLIMENKHHLVDTNASCADEIIQQLNFAMVDAFDKSKEVIGGVRDAIDGRNSTLQSDDVQYTLKAPGA